jgi:hypothetical protein
MQRLQASKEGIDAAITLLAAESAKLKSNIDQYALDDRVKALVKEDKLEEALENAALHLFPP